VSDPIIASGIGSGGPTPEDINELIAVPRVPITLEDGRVFGLLEWKPEVIMDQEVTAWMKVLIYPPEVKDES
jgi:hypothetical protein